MFIKRLDNFIFVAPSRRKGKKYDVYDLNKKYITSFGALGYEQYRDKISYYSKFNHLDKNRKDNYYKRHGKANKLTAKYFSHKYLW